MRKLVKIFPFLVWLRLTTIETIKADFIAGLTGAIIVLPQSVAFAVIAGMPPEYGIYTFIAILVTVVFHLYRRNALLSIIAGTVIYMFAVQM